MSLSFEPLHDYVLINPIANSQLTKGGIMLPQNSTQDLFQTAEVVAVGKGLVDGGNVIPLTVQVGDKVIYHRGAVDNITVYGEVYFLLKEKAIMGILR